MTLYPLPYRLVFYEAQPTDLFPQQIVSCVAAKTRFVAYYNSISGSQMRVTGERSVSHMNIWLVLPLLASMTMSLVGVCVGETILLTPSQCPNPVSVAVNSATGVVYAACGTGNVISYDGTTVRTMTNSSQCPYPSGVAVNTATGVVYAACGTGNVISYDGTTVRTVATSSQCPNPISVAVNTVSGVVYAACNSGGVISYDGTTVRTMTNSSQCSQPNSVAVNTATGVVYATCSSGAMISCNGATVRKLATCALPTSVAVNVVTGVVYATCFFDSNVIAYDGTVGTAVTAVSNCLDPNSVAVDAATGMVYAACSGYGGGVISYDGTTVTTVITFSLCPNPNSVAVDAATGAVYAGCYSGGGVSSSLCSPGAYMSVSSGCSSCPAGTFQNQSGQTSCINCPDGTSSAAGQTVCADCIPGKYSASSTAFICTSCFSGTFQNQSGQTSCINCPDGTSSAAGQTVCADCIPGKYSASSTAFICTMCAAGKYQYLSGQPYCSNCSAGTYNTLTGQVSASSCTQCPPGTQSPVAGCTLPATCVPCPAGTASPSPGQALCSLCLPGYYQPTTGSIQCLPCRSGSYTASAGTQQCQACPQATPESPVAATSLTQCVAPVCRSGNYTQQTDLPCQAQCPRGFSCQNGYLQACAPGSYAESLAQSICAACGQGRFSAVTGSRSSADCLPCPLSTYSNSSIAGSCQLCPPTTTTVDVHGVDISACVPMVGCSSGCPLGSSQPLSPADLLPESQSILDRLSLSSAGNTTDMSSFYSPLRTCSSLRLAAFQSDTVLMAASATANTPSNLTQSSANTLSGTSIVVMIVLLSVAFVPWFIYRKVPASLADYVDQFSYNHKPETGEPILVYPTQFGSAMTWSFLCVGTMVAVLLATAPNTQLTTGIVPPSSNPLAGTARGDFEITLRVHSGKATVAAQCSTGSQAGFRLTSQAGFSASYNQRVIASGSGSSCSVATDCLGCGLSGVSAIVGFTFPYDAQLIEWEVWVNSASPGGWSRRYGVLQQLPNQLLDAHGQLQFSLMESYYANEQAGSVTQSGYENEYSQYFTVTAQSLDTFSSQSRVQVDFLFTKSDVLFQSTVSNKLSTLQILTVMLSALGSLFSGFAILFALLERYVLKRRSGRVQKHAETGKVFVAEIDPTPVKKLYTTDAEPSSPVRITRYVRSTSEAPLPSPSAASVISSIPE